MKITRIKALCKAAKKCVIYHDNDRQFLGTTDAIYPADSLTLTPGSIAKLFDMQDAPDLLRVEEAHLHACGIAPMMERPHELREAGCINYLGDTLYALASDTTGELLWVMADYIKATEYTEGYRRYWLAENKYGEPLVVIEDGLLVIGVVKPIPGKTAESIKRMLEGLQSMRPIGSPNPGEAKTSDEIDGQMGMDDLLPGLDTEEDDDGATGK